MRWGGDIDIKKKDVKIPTLGQQYVLYIQFKEEQKLGQKPPPPRQ